MSIRKDFKQLLKPYYLFNILLSLSYVVLKRLPVVCNYLFATDQCEFEGRETEILFFLLIVVMIRTRKAGSMSMISYLSSSFIYTKLANLILWFNADLLMGLTYGVVFIFGAFLLPEPTYSGPDNVMYFRSPQGLEEELQRDKSVVWLVEFYTVWNPSCVSFAPTFAKLSNEYSLNNLKFAKIDIGRYPDVGKKYRVSDSSFSKQLPTLVLFRGGKEELRRPIVDSRGKVVNFAFSEDNIKSIFSMNNLYDNCKMQMKNKKTIKSD